MIRRSWVLSPFVMSIVACAGEPPPTAEAPPAPPPPAAPATPCEGLAAPLGTLRRLTSIVGLARSMPVRPLYPKAFEARLEEASREARAAGAADASFAKVANDAGDRLAMIAAAARALEAAKEGDRARVRLVEEMERGELAVLQIEERCAKDGGAAGGRRSAAALESGWGKVSAAALQRALRSGAPAMKACGDAGLRRDASLGGALRVRFAIAPDGRVSEARDAAAGPLDALDWGSPTSAPPLGDAEVIACLLGAFKGITFPKPEGGTFTGTHAIEVGRAR